MAKKVRSIYKRPASKRLYLIYLSSGFDAFDETEEDNNPGQHETEHKIPVRLSKLINPWAQL